MGIMVKKIQSIQTSFLFFFILLLLIADDVYSENQEIEVKINSAVSGIIQKVYVQKGQLVKKGDLLLEFDNSLINSNLDEVNSALKLSKINLSEAKKEFQRSQELYERTVLSEHDLQNSKVLYYKAIAQYAKAKNTMIHREWEKKEHKLYAPFDAQIAQVFCYEGQYINNKFSSQVLFSVQKK